MGMLAASPEEAWGNAAIPGFGIGAPTAQPGARRPRPPAEVPGGDVHEAALEKYDIPDEELVLSRGLQGGMAIYRGHADSRPRSTTTSPSSSASSAP